MFFYFSFPITDADTDIFALLKQVTGCLRQNRHTDAKETLLELLCLQPNMIGCAGHMTSLEHMIYSVDCDDYSSSI